MPMTHMDVLQVACEGACDDLCGRTAGTVVDLRAVPPVLRRGYESGLRRVELGAAGRV
jgi:hypothetical protein